MSDVFTVERRSEIMKLIKSKNTKPELLVRRHLHFLGYRFRLHSKHLKGSPDIILKKYNTVIFVNGCFWHGHEEKNCKISRLPKSNTDYWVEKIMKTKNRDLTAKKSLKELGWNIIEIWECQLKPKHIETTFKHLNDLLQNHFKN